MRIKTLKYGYIPVAYKTEFLLNECIDIVETCDNKLYEIRQTLNGYIVALFMNV